MINNAYISNGGGPEMMITDINQYTSDPTLQREGGEGGANGIGSNYNQ